MLEQLLKYLGWNDESPRRVQVLYRVPPADPLPGQEFEPISLRVPDSQAFMHQRIELLYRLVILEDYVEEAPDGAVGILPDGFALGY